MLGNSNQLKAIPIYIDGNKGKVKTKDGQLFDFVSGLLVGINYDTRKNSRGKDNTYYTIELKSAENDNQYNLVIEHNGISTGLISSLTGVTDYTQPIVITPYLKGSYCKISITQDGKSIGWGIDKTDIPKWDTPEHVQYFQNISNELNNKVNE